MPVFSRSLDVFNRISKMLKTWFVDRKRPKSAIPWGLADGIVFGNSKKRVKKSQPGGDCTKKVAAGGPNQRIYRGFKDPPRSPKSTLFLSLFFSSLLRSSLLCSALLFSFIFLSSLLFLFFFVLQFRFDFLVLLNSFLTVFGCSWACFCTPRGPNNNPRRPKKKKNPPGLWPRACQIIDNSFIVL